MSGSLSSKSSSLRPARRDQRRVQSFQDELALGVPIGDVPRDRVQAAPAVADDVPRGDGPPDLVQPPPVLCPG